MQVSINSFVAEERDLLERFAKEWARMQKERGVENVPHFLEMGEWSEQFADFIDAMQNEGGFTQ